MRNNTGNRGQIGAGWQGGKESVRNPLQEYWSSSPSKVIKRTVLPEQIKQMETDYQNGPSGRKVN